eukprot:s726_g27.t1
MNYWQPHRIDVWIENDLDRYEQLFEIQLAHVIFGMGEQRGLHFVSFFTIEDVCILRCTAFAVAVEVHDNMEDLAAAHVTLQHQLPGGHFLDRCSLQ